MGRKTLQEWLDETYGPLPTTPARTSKKQEASKKSTPAKKTTGFSPSRLQAFLAEQPSGVAPSKGGSSRPMPETAKAVKSAKHKGLRGAWDSVYDKSGLDSVTHTALGVPGVKQTLDVLGTGARAAQWTLGITNALRDPRTIVAALGEQATGKQIKSINGKKLDVHPVKNVLRPDKAVFGKTEDRISFKDLSESYDAFKHAPKPVQYLVNAAGEIATDPSIHTTAGAMTTAASKDVAEQATKTAAQDIAAIQAKKAAGELSVRKAAIKTAKIENKARKVVEGGDHLTRKALARRLYDKGFTTDAEKVLRGRMPSKEALDAVDAKYGINLYGSGSFETVDKAYNALRDKGLTPGSRVGRMAATAGDTARKLNIDYEKVPGAAAFAKAKGLKIYQQIVEEGNLRARRAASSAEDRYKKAVEARLTRADRALIRNADAVTSDALYRAVQTDAKLAAGVGLSQADEAALKHLESKAPGIVDRLRQLNADALRERRLFDPRHPERPGYVRGIETEEFKKAQETGVYKKRYKGSVPDSAARRKMVAGDEFLGVKLTSGTTHEMNDIAIDKLGMPIYDHSNFKNSLLEQQRGVRRHVSNTAFADAMRRAGLTEDEVRGVTPSLERRRNLYLKRAQNATRGAELTETQIAANADAAARTEAGANALIGYKTDAALGPKKTLGNGKTVRQGGLRGLASDAEKEARQWDKLANTPSSEERAVERLAKEAADKKAAAATLRKAGLVGDAEHAAELERLTQERAQAVAARDAAQAELDKAKALRADSNTRARLTRELNRQNTKLAGAEQRLHDATEVARARAEVAFTRAEERLGKAKEAAKPQTVAPQLVDTAPLEAEVARLQGALPDPLNKPRVKLTEEQQAARASLKDAETALRAASTVHEQLQVIWDKYENGPRLTAEEESVLRRATGVRRGPISDEKFAAALDKALNEISTRQGRVDAAKAVVAPPDAGIAASALDVPSYDVPVPPEPAYMRNRKYKNQGALLVEKQKELKQTLIDNAIKEKAGPTLVEASDEAKQKVVTSQAEYDRHLQRVVTPQVSKSVTNAVDKAKREVAAVHQAITALGDRGVEEVARPNTQTVADLTRKIDSLEAAKAQLNDTWSAHKVAVERADEAVARVDEKLAKAKEAFAPYANDRADAAQISTDLLNKAKEYYTAADDALKQGDKMRSTLLKFQGAAAEAEERNMVLLGKQRARIARNVKAYAALPADQVVNMLDDAMRASFGLPAISQDVFKVGGKDVGGIGGKYAFANGVQQYADRDVIALYERMGQLKQPGVAPGVMKAYDTVMSRWKAWQLLGPGFHARNGLSAFWMNWMRGVDTESYALFTQNYKRYRSGGLQALPEGGVRDAFSQMERLGVIGGGSQGVQIADAGEGAVTRGILGERFKAIDPTSLDFKPLQLNHAAGEGVENLVRGTQFLDWYMKTGDAEEAARRVLETHYDHLNMSEFERRVVRRIIPFYSWMRNNFPAQLELAVARPGSFRAYLDAKKVIEDGTQGDGPLDPMGWGEGRLPIRLPFKVQGYNTFIDIEMPWRDIPQIMKDPLGWAGRSSNPLIQQAIESWTGSSLQYGEPYRRDGRPSMQKTPVGGLKEVLAAGIHASGLSGKLGLPKVAKVGGRYYVSQYDSQKMDRFLPGVDKADRTVMVGAGAAGFFPSEYERSRILGNVMSDAFGISTLVNNDTRMEAQDYRLAQQVRNKAADAQWRKDAETKNAASTKRPTATSGKVNKLQAWLATQS